jgi:hypothetical protein
MRLINQIRQRQGKDHPPEIRIKVNLPPGFPWPKEAPEEAPGPKP